jgi:uncharacterized protein (TIGR00730 family)
MTDAICVFCGSQTGNDSSYVDAADSLGREIAVRRIDLIYGGGDLGLMGAVSAGVTELGGNIIGIIPEFIASKLPSGIEHESHITVADLFERKALMIEKSDAFIVLPGGIGTYDEFFEILSWKQLGQARQPIGILNVNKYFDPLIHLIDHSEKQGFITSAHRVQIQIETDPGTLIDRMENINRNGS